MLLPVARKAQPLDLKRLGVVRMMRLHPQGGSALLTRLPFQFPVTNGVIDLGPRFEPFRMTFTCSLLIPTFRSATFRTSFTTFVVLLHSRTFRLVPAFRILLRAFLALVEVSIGHSRVGVEVRKRLLPSALEACFIHACDVRTVLLKMASPLEPGTSSTDEADPTAPARVRPSQR